MNRFRGKREKDLNFKLNTAVKPACTITVDDEDLLNIMNGKLNLFILIDYGRVEITNHVFHYDVRLSNRDYERITYLYDMETEKRRSNTEMTIKSNIKNTLEKLYEAISKKTEKSQ